jgi:septum formation protein
MKSQTKSKEGVLILASGSPRRRELLDWAGISLEVVVSDVDETPIAGESPKKMVARLSLMKAKAVQKKVGPHRWIVAADTTVVSPLGKNLGKPRHQAEAKQMLKLLAGKTHRVLTGFSCLKGKRQITQVVETKVRFRPLTPKEIDQYIKRGESMDKAGGYAAQGFGMVLIESIQGSYTNVVGLPMAELLKALPLSFYRGLHK